MFEREDDVSCGLAVSLLQDSAEMFVWTLSKKENVTLKSEAGFVAQLQALKDKPLTLAGATGLTDLNEARVNFEHYGNLPSITERPKFEAAAETFLRAGMRDHFAVDFDTLTMVDLVARNERFRAQAA